MGNTARLKGKFDFKTEKGNFMKWYGKGYCANPWRAEDVKHMKPKWSLKKCEEWLNDNEDRIQDRLTEVGYEVIDSFLQMRSYDE